MAHNQDKETAVNRELERIARDVLKIETLDTRRSDSLDFYDLAVWSVREALTQAYAAGLRTSHSREAKGVEMGTFEIGPPDLRQYIQILQNASNLYTVINWEHMDGEHSSAKSARFVNIRLAFTHAMKMAENEIENLVETIES
jgi:hypothetical protein